MLLFNLIGFLFVLTYDVSCAQIPVIQKLPGISNIVAGQKFKISCTLASGSTPVDFLWFKDDQRIVSGKHFHIKSLEEDNSFLIINSISSDDTGDYKCTAKNSIGSDQINIKVIVQGKNQFFFLFY